MTKTEVRLYRGLPGSGKSAAAMEWLQADTPDFRSHSIVEADHFFTKHGEYKWNQSLLPAAHDWCFGEFARHLFIVQPDRLAVSNTFTRLWEMKRYIDIMEKHNIPFSVHEPNTSWAKDPKICAAKCTHGVSEEIIRKMLDRWEEYTGE